MHNRLCRMGHHVTPQYTKRSHQPLNPSSRDVIYSGGDVLVNSYMANVGIQRRRIQTAPPCNAPFHNVESKPIISKQVMHTRSSNIKRSIHNATLTRRLTALSAK